MEKTIFEPIQGNTPELFKVSRCKMEELGNAIDLIRFIDKQEANLVVYQKKKYLVSATYGNGTGIGNKLIKAYEVVPEQLYRYRIPAPMWYTEHWHAVANGQRDQKYTGIKFKNKGRIFVCTDEVQFVEDDSPYYFNEKLF